MSAIAILGTGIMGAAMARRLLDAGHRVTVWNRTRAKAEPLAAAGARLADSPAAAARGAGLIIAMLGDDDASREVWLGPQGVVHGDPRPGTLAVEHSTLSHPWVRHLQAELQGRGLRYLDAPVTGGPDGAAAGTLTLLAGGDPADLEAAAGALGCYCARQLHLGPPGAGTAYKLVVNLVATAQITSLAEGLLIAEAAGLDPEQVAGAMAQGSVASPLVRYLLERMKPPGNHRDIYFYTRWRAKDAAYGLDLAARVGQPAPTAAAAEALFRDAMAQGLGDANSSIVIELLRAMKKNPQAAGPPAKGPGPGPAPGTGNGESPDGAERGAASGDRDA